MTIVVMKMKRMMLPISLVASALRTSCMATDSRRLSAWPSRRAKTAPKTTMPRAPSWVRTSRMTWPMNVKSLPGLATANPVTQVALVDMNSASIGRREARPGVDFGNMSSAAPVTMRMMKLTTRVLLGFLPVAARRTESRKNLIVTSNMR
jgi:hypothetical protein